jgi:hypothetical protein
MHVQLILLRGVDKATVQFAWSSSLGTTTSTEHPDVTLPGVGPCILAAAFGDIGMNITSLPSGYTLYQYADPTGSLVHSMYLAARADQPAGSTGGTLDVGYDTNAGDKIFFTIGFADAGSGGTVGDAEGAGASVTTAAPDGGATGAANVSGLGVTVLTSAPAGSASAPTSVTIRLLNSASDPTPVIGSVKCWTRANNGAAATDGGTAGLDATPDGAGNITLTGLAIAGGLGILTVRLDAHRCRNYEVTYS